MVGEFGAQVSVGADHQVSTARPPSFGFSMLDVELSLPSRGARSGGDRSENSGAAHTTPPRAISAS
jgi:hypothetical protein